MKKKLVIYVKLPEDKLESLKSEFDVTLFSGVNSSNYDQFIEAVNSAHALLGSSVKIGHKELKHASSLQVISTISTGIDCFDLDALNQKNIALMHTPTVLTETTADTIFALLMCTARRTTELNNLILNGQWTQSIRSEHYGTDVHGKTIGILGMGKIGYALAKRAHFGFDMSVNYYNRSRNENAETNLNAQKMELDELLQSSDFICSVLPATPQTNQLIGEREFNLMKPSAIFINAGRGNLVDENALIQALKNGTIRAAGLDVFKSEPLPTDSELMSLNNLVMFPHIGSATIETRSAMLDCAINNIRAALAGDLSENCANP